MKILGASLDVAGQDRAGALANGAAVSTPSRVLREESEAEAIRQSSQTFMPATIGSVFFLEGTKSLAYGNLGRPRFSRPDNITSLLAPAALPLGCAFGLRELLKAGQILKLRRALFACAAAKLLADRWLQGGVDAGRPAIE